MLVSRMQNLITLFERINTAEAVYPLTEANTLGQKPIPFGRSKYNCGNEPVLLLTIRTLAFLIRISLF